MAQMQNWLGIIVLVGTILATSGIGFLTLRADMSDMRREIAAIRSDTSELRNWAQSRFDRVDAKFEALDARLDAMEQENIRRDARIETLGQLIILTHGDGVVSEKDLKDIWASANQQLAPD